MQSFRISNNILSFYARDLNDALGEYFFHTKPRPKEEEFRPMYESHRAAHPQDFELLLDAAKRRRNDGHDRWSIWQAVDVVRWG